MPVARWCRKPLSGHAHAPEDSLVLLDGKAVQGHLVGNQFLCAASLNYSDQEERSKVHDTNSMACSGSLHWETRYA